MKKINLLFAGVAALGALASCGSNNDDKVIRVAASETPHAQILKDAVAPLLAQKGYTLEVTVLDWTLQNDAVKNGDYDANYFQHRPYLQQYDSGSAAYSETYTYINVFPTALVHFEPLRIYEGSAKASDFEKNKTTATFEICADVSNEIRALDLLVACGAISSYDVDGDGNPIKLPERIKTIDENQLVPNREDYDYAVLPCNTALTGNLTANPDLPTETSDVADLRANVIAANVIKYGNDAGYREKINALTDAVLDKSVATYITKTWNNVIAVEQKDLRR